MKKTLVVHVLLFLFSIPTAFSATIVSAQTGDWDVGTTWIGGIIPISTDTVIISDGHTVTKDQTGSYTHSGDLLIETTGKLIMDVGNASSGFIYDGGTFHVFGELELPFPDRDFLVTGNSFFWAHDGAVLFVSDDLQMAGNSVNIVEKICLEVDDDFNLDGTNASLCGDGGISIGDNTGSNTMDFTGGATDAQICSGTIVYRGSGGTCVTTVESGTGNNPPTAVDDQTSTGEDQAVAIDVLDAGAFPSDSDPDGDNLTIRFVGLNGIDGGTKNGGTVSIDDNGTPLNPADDVVDYIPPIGFTGVDTFSYVIFDGNGAIATAIVQVTVNSAVLPVELTEFSGIEDGCKNILVWMTASEDNNDRFEIEKSQDGQTFVAIGSVAGRGNSTQSQFYQFIDSNPGKLNYYRLRQIDFDGTETLSEVFNMTNSCLAGGLKSGIVKIFPNPLITDQLSVKLIAEEKEQVIDIVNQNGKVLRRMSLELEIGINTIRVDMASFPAGIYYIKSGRFVQRFVKLAD